MPEDGRAPGAVGASLRVELVVALPRASCRVALRLPAGATVGHAVEAAFAGEHGAALRAALGGAAPAGVGVFGRVVPPQRPLRDGDRVELYRPLSADPKLARRQRVERRRAAQGRGPWRPGG